MTFIIQDSALFFYLFLLLVFITFALATQIKKNLIFKFIPASAAKSFASNVIIKNDCKYDCLLFNYTINDS